MASSPLRAAAGQQQSRLLDMQKKFQQKHLAAVGAVTGAAAGSSTGGGSVDREQPVPPVRRMQQPSAVQRRAAGSGNSGVGVGTGSGEGDSLVQVDVKGKVRQLFADRNQNVQAPGYQHYQQHQQQHQQQHGRRQRRRSLTGRDRSRPLRPLSDADDDPLSKTVCFTAPTMTGGADLVGISSAGGDVRDELLALFGRLPNLGGRLLSETFRGGKMKTAQSAPELKWLLDGHGGPGPPPVAGGTGPGRDDDDDDGLQRPTGRLNSKTASVMTKKPLANPVNGNAGGGGAILGRGVTKKAAVNGGGGGGDSFAGGNGGKITGPGTNKLLLPPVVQPTVINALAAGADAASAVASVNAAAAAGVQKPVVRAGKLPPAPKPAIVPRRRPMVTTPSPKVVAADRQPAGHRTMPAVVKPAKQQPAADRGPPAADRGPPAAGMARCPLCARDFAADRLPKHEEVCRRTKERDRKRKVFDTSKKRLEFVAAEAGVDVASFKKKSEKEDQRAAEKLQKKKDAWRRKHDALVRNVRAARAVQRHLAAGGSVRDLPPELDAAGQDPDDEVDSDLVKCPHCNRTFNEASAERHIPLCAERQRNAAARQQNKKR